MRRSPSAISILPIFLLLAALPVRAEKTVVVALVAKTKPTPINAAAAFGLARA